MRYQLTAGPTTPATDKNRRQMISNTPEKIYLVIDDEENDFTDFKEFDSENILWCEDRINERDIEYVRATPAGGWIRTADRLPEDMQGVLFVVKSRLPHYNGKVYGGTYTGSGFVTPGVQFSASHWQPLPEPPKPATL